MSTKVSLSINMKNFPADSPNANRVPAERRDPNVMGYHLYEECLEEDGSLYLELEGAEFQADNHGVTVKIPAEVWNRIIKVGPRNPPAKIFSQQEMQAKFLPLLAEGHRYRKTATIMARPAQTGELVVTMTASGEETRNQAKDGHYLCRNPGGEHYLLSGEKLAARYEALDFIDDAGWRLYKPTGTVRALTFIAKQFGLPEKMQFIAPWGEPMALLDGDILATTDGVEVYRIGAEEFRQTYQQE